MTDEKQPKYEIITYKGQKARRYPDGSIRDTNGHFLERPPKLDDHLITSANASDYVRRRQELRAQAIAGAAQAAVEREDYRLQYGDMAWVAAIGEAQYIKATTPDDPKSTAAANFLFEQAGISAKQAPSVTGDSVVIPSSVVSRVLDMLRDRLTGDNG